MPQLAVDLVEATDEKDGDKNTLRFLDCHKQGCNFFEYDDVTNTNKEQKTFQDVPAFPEIIREESELIEEYTDDADLEVNIDLMARESQDIADIIDIDDIYKTEEEEKNNDDEKDNKKKDNDANKTKRQ